MRRAGLTDWQLAAATGVDKSTVKSWLAGTVPTGRHRAATAVALGEPEERLWPGSPSSGAGSEAGRLVPLLHRRHGWRVTATVALTGAVGYSIVALALGVGVSEPFTTVSEAALVALLAVGAFGLIAALADTVRFHCASSVARELARANVSHVALKAHAYRYRYRAGRPILKGLYPGGADC